MDVLHPSVGGSEAVNVDPDIETMVAAGGDDLHDAFGELLTHGRGKQIDILTRAPIDPVRLDRITTGQREPMLGRGLQTDLGQPSVGVIRQGYVLLIGLSDRLRAWSPAAG